MSMWTSFDVTGIDQPPVGKYENRVPMAIMQSDASIRSRTGCSFAQLPMC